ncbi:MAG: MBOAT family protein, partial [Magnetovibrio sp.]|nr:MBOAT family protein [Magnetovibrio sp.]
MIFSSFEFIYLFFPVTFAGFLLLRYWRSEMGIILWLIAASLVFYAYWNPPYLFLLMASVGFNYALHLHISKYHDPWVLGFGISANLGAIGYYKYAGFFSGTMNALSGSQFELGDIALPLAISFFTFQQIAFLVESYRGHIEECGFAKYTLFVVFFPQLIAGPIVMQRDTVPQFHMAVFQNRLALNVAVGLSIFIICLFKKLVLADSAAPYATAVFSLADAGEEIPFSMAWSGALAYTFQIYFDFSGYCDMAIGLARCFGIRLPINFNSPYKAVDIVDFWRRWHITLSHFLRDYLYIPLGGSRAGKVQRYLNLSITMLLGGLWHGASWTFVVWGGLHGVYLMINHAWSAHRKSQGRAVSPLGRIMGRALTLVAVIFAWVFFRAETFGGAASVATGMIGLNGFAGVGEVPQALAAVARGVPASFVWFIPLTFVVLALPNTAELAASYRPTLYFRKALGLNNWKPRNGRWSVLSKWRPTPVRVGSLSVMAVIGIAQMYRLGELS